jgi:hypothetical protein
MCSHPYLKKLGPGKSVCLECGEVVIPGKADHPKDAEELVLPPVVYLIDASLWKTINPWPLMPYSIPKKYRWYVSFIYGRQYLVMPVYDKGEAVFYSARCIEKDCPKKYKYLTPEGRSRRMWQSGVKGRYKKVLYGEGIADAAYLSLIAPSSALMGCSGVLVAGAILILDGDIKGIEAAFKLVQEARLRGVVDSQVVTLPPGTDPTDLPLSALRKIIKEQTGIRL